VIILIKLLLGLLLPLLIGYAVLSLCFKKQTHSSALERFALAWALGTGFLTWLMFCLVMIKVPLTVTNIAIPALLFLGIAWPIVIRHGYPLFNTADLIKTAKNIFSRPPVDGQINYWLERLLLLAIAGKVGYVFFEALIKPVVAWDAWANWALKAKIFFLDPVPLVSYFGNYRAGLADYPLHLPLLESWLYTCLGEWNDQLVKIIFPLYFLSLLILFYYVLRRIAPRLNSLLFTFLLSSLPFLVYHATIEYADFPLALYYTFTLFLLYLWAEKSDQGCFFCSSILAGLLPLVKKEGQVDLLIILLLLAVILWSKRSALAEKAKAFISYALFPALLYLPWLIFSKLLRLEGVGVQTPHLISFQVLLDRASNIIAVFYNKMFLGGNWNMLWLLLCLALILNFRPVWSSKLKFILLSLGLNLAFLIAIYLFTDSYTFLLEGTTLNRNMLILMPSVVLLTAGAFTFGLKKEPAMPAGGKNQKKRKH
jgi:hypothetical protein